MQDWIKLGVYSMFENLPVVPKEEVLAWDDRGGYLVGHLCAVHDGNSIDEVYFTCEAEYSCLSYVSHYIIIVPPKQTENGH